jgi:cobalt/nickel transport system permease protein
VKKILLFLILITLIPSNAFGMHIMEGFLPLNWAVIWWLVTIPFLIIGLKHIQNIVNKNPGSKMILAMAGAFAFVLSALKLPSVTGSCSHPTGVGLGAILFGPFVMTVLGFIVLIFQAILLAHGGLTTLGANTFSMGIAGPVASYLIFRGTKALKIPLWMCVFLSASLGNLLTYIVTSLQLALAYPDKTGGFIASLTKFLGIFAITQIPLAISEGLLTVLIMNMIYSYGKDMLEGLNIMEKEKNDEE